MTDLLNYSLTDFLPFSRGTYLRLFELYNVRFWPVVVAGMLLGAWLLWSLRRPGPGCSRLCLGGLAVCWLWVAWAFLSESYAPLNWAARHFAIAFAFQGLLLFAFSLALERTGPPRRSSAAAAIAYGLIAVAVLLVPIAGFFSGRLWYGLDLFGSAPDPTVAATLGVVLMLRNRFRAVLMVVPAAWAAYSGLTLLAMQDPLWPLLPGAALVSIVVAIWQNTSTRGKKNPPFGGLS